MVVTVNNQDRTHKAFCLILQNCKEGFERLSVRIIWRVFEIRTGVKTNNNRRRIQTSGLVESLAQPYCGCCCPSPRSVVVARCVSRERFHSVLASHQMYGREYDAVMNPATILNELRKWFVTVL